MNTGERGQTKQTAALRPAAGLLCFHAVKVYEGFTVRPVEKFRAIQ